MVKVSIEIRNGAARFAVAVRAESIRQAVNIAVRLYPGGDVRVKFPLDHEGFFVQEATAPSEIAA